MITANVAWRNLPGFQRQMKEFIEVAEKPAQVVLKSQSKLFVRDVAKATPPMGGNGEGVWNQSFAAQRKTGKEAVAKDIRKGFKSIYDTKIFERIKNEKSRKDLLAYLVRGDYTKARKMLDRLSVRLTLVVQPNDRLHKSIRNSRGRITGRKAFLVMKANQIPAFIKKKQELVGSAKSGWTKAAQALGVKLPEWISDKSGSGIYKEEFSRSFNSITLGNTVDYIQTHGARLQIVERALRRRTESMKHQVEAMMKRAFSGYKAK